MAGVVKRTLILSKCVYNNVSHDIFVFVAASEPISLGFVSIPKLWLYVLGNSVTQYVCIRGVFVLTTECPSLVVTLIVTLRKFVSLVFSIFYFQNPFTIQHWCATILVFGGTALFAGVFHSLAEFLGLSAESRPEVPDTESNSTENQVQSDQLTRLKQE